MNLSFVKKIVLECPLIDLSKTNFSFLSKILGFECPLIDHSMKTLIK